MRKALIIILILSLFGSCSVTKNMASNESTQNSELQKESESSSLQKDSEVKGSHQVSIDTSNFNIVFDPIAYPYWKYDSTTGTYIPLKEITDAAHNKDNWVKINPDGSIEAKGNIKEVKSNSKKEITKKDSTNKQSLDSNSQEENLKYITKTITVTKTLLVERKPDYWGITKWVGGIVTVILLGLWLYKKWMQRFTIIP